MYVPEEGPDAMIVYRHSANAALWLSFVPSDAQDIDEHLINTAPGFRLQSGKVLLAYSWSRGVG